MKRGLKNLKKDLNLFFLCIVLALIGWGVFYLSSVKTFSIDIPIRFSNVPDNKSIIRLQKDTLNLSVLLNGFEYLSSKLHDTYLDVNLAKPTTSYFYTVQDSDIKNLGTAKIKYFSPDTLFFHISPAKTSSLPIQLFQIPQLEKNHILVEPINVYPKTVIVKGKDSLISNLHYVTANLQNITEIHDNQNISVKLSSSEKIEIKPETAIVNFKIKLALSLDTVIDIQKIAGSFGKMLFYPSKIRIEYSFPVDYIDSISPNFKVQFVDVNQKQKRGFKRVVVSSDQYFTHINYTDPAYVEFFTAK